MKARRFSILRLGAPVAAVHWDRMEGVLVGLWSSSFFSNPSLLENIDPMLTCVAAWAVVSSLSCTPLPSSPGVLLPSTEDGWGCWLCAAPTRGTGTLLASATIDHRWDGPAADAVKIQYMYCMCCGRYVFIYTEMAVHERRLCDTVEFSMGFGTRIPVPCGAGGAGTSFWWRKSSR